MFVTFYRSVCYLLFYYQQYIFFNLYKNLKKRTHKYHLVDRSPWPFCASLCALFLTSSAVLYMHGFANSGFMLFLAFLFLVVVAFFWWRDVIRESFLEGHHTMIVQIGIKIGIVLFIVSEIMFFVSFFWAYFHSSLVPTIQIGCVWPPVGIKPFSPWGVPLLNTIILLLSGATVTWVHYAIIGRVSNSVVYGFLFTVILAIFFTGLQGMEYYEAPFTIASSVYGAIFFIATGFHGLHVIVGTIYLFVCFLRYLAGHFSERHHVGFEGAAWYWHFVDVVWLFLFISIYWWGSWNALGSDLIYGVLLN